MARVPSISCPKAHMVRAYRLAGAAGQAAVNMQRKALIHRNAPAGNATHQSDTPPRRIGFGQGNRDKWGNAADRDRTRHSGWLRRLVRSKEISGRKIEGFMILKSGKLDGLACVCCSLLPEEITGNQFTEVMPGVYSPRWSLIGQCRKSIIWDRLGPRLTRYAGKGTNRRYNSRPSSSYAAPLSSWKLFYLHCAGCSG